MTKKKIKKPNKTVDLNDINNKIQEICKSNKNKIFKTKKIKINLLTDSKVKTEKKNNITLDESEKKNIGKKGITQNHKDINESSKIIKANINLIEKEINAFKEHNLFIKQQLEKMYNTNK